MFGRDTRENPTNLAAIVRPKQSFKLISMPASMSSDSRGHVG